MPEKIPLQRFSEELKQKVASNSIQVSQLVDEVIDQSVLHNTSDIHLEPHYEGLRIRFRIDGMFQEVARLPSHLSEQVIARLKVMSNLLPHKREIAQEGRISKEVGARNLDFRISVIPTVTGEKAVIRLFDPDRALFSLNQLGFPHDVRERFEELLLDLQGILIFTGPSSSGKTTSMYAGLQKIHEERSSSASIVTIEDPVEYSLGFFSQMEVNRRVGIDFAAGLSAILRQDPEVIMVGEIRDFETCSIAMRAGLTGHLVLTTIHAGNSCEVLTRLLDMGIEPFIVTSAIRGVLATRLIRKTCKSCVQPYKPNDQQLGYFASFEGIEKVEFTHGVGCDECLGSGYRGRTAICELLEMDEELQRLVLEKQTTDAFIKHAVNGGMRTLFENGFDLIRAGVTTTEEILRVLGSTTGKAQSKLRKQGVA